MTGEPAKIFHGVGIGPLSKILAVKEIVNPLVGMKRSTNGSIKPNE